eukprot:COSAG06_NODE_67171_length_252_cov_1.326797_1_plen_32_part_10
MASTAMWASSIPDGALLLLVLLRRHHLLERVH